MEKLKAKHDHKLTDILKVFLFALFLIMPFLTYMPNALYYGCNEYAKNETTTNVDIQYKYQSNEVNSADDLVLGNVYHLDNLYLDNEGYEFHFLALKCDDFNSNIENLTYDEMFVENYDSSILNYIDIDVYDYGVFLYFSNMNGYASFSTGSNFELTFTNLDFIIIGGLSDFSDILVDFNQGLPSESDFNVIESVDIQTDVENTITESMQHAWQRMWQSQMYNWTNGSVLKQGLDNFTGVFGVSDTSYFTNLIVYELIMVAIYIVIDIVITMFKWLTHLVGEK